MASKLLLGGLKQYLHVFSLWKSRKNDVSINMEAKDINELHDLRNRYELNYGVIAVR